MAAGGMSTGLRAILLVSVLCSISLSTGALPKRRPHWLDIPQAKLTAAEKSTRGYYDMLFNMVDDDSNKEITEKELLTALNPTEAHDEFQYYGLKQILASDNSKLMNPTTFEDMWYIMTEVKQYVEDSKDVSVLLPFFRHVDTNEDGKITKREMDFLIKTGGRTKEMEYKKTKYRLVMKALDKDQSGGLSHDEIWAPIKQIIEIEGETTMSCIDIDDMLKHITRDAFEKGTLDFKQLCKCMDQDNDLNVSSTTEEFDFISRLDRNYDDEIEEHELAADMAEELKLCVAEFDKREKKIPKREKQEQPKKKLTGRLKDMIKLRQQQKAEADAEYEAEAAAEDEAAAEYEAEAEDLMRDEL